MSLFQFTTSIINLNNYSDNHSLDTLQLLVNRTKRKRRKKRTEKEQAPTGSERVKVIDMKTGKKVRGFFYIFLNFEYERMFLFFGVFFAEYVIFPICIRKIYLGMFDTVQKMCFFAYQMYTDQCGYRNVYPAWTFIISLSF